jgi:hypothetical protein
MMPHLCQTFSSRSSRSSPSTGAAEGPNGGWRGLGIATGASWPRRAAVVGYQDGAPLAVVLAAPPGRSRLAARVQPGCCGVLEGRRQSPCGKGNF